MSTTAERDQQIRDALPSWKEEHGLFYPADYVRGGAPSVCVATYFDEAERPPEHQFFIDPDTAVLDTEFVDFETIDEVVAWLDTNRPEIAK